MKQNLWLKYFIYICLILVTVFAGHNVMKGIIEDYKRWDVSIHYFSFISFVCYGGVGAALGLEKLVPQIKKQGKWRVNIPKIIFIGIPSLYFSIAIFMFFINVPIIQEVLMVPIQVLLTGDTSYISIFQLILGYTIVTSFYREKEMV